MRALREADHACHADGRTAQVRDCACNKTKPHADGLGRKTQLAIRMCELVLLCFPFIVLHISCEVEYPCSSPLHVSEPFSVSKRSTTRT